jgi:transcriptional regulator with XRE-family HTH domain
MDRLKSVIAENIIRLRRSRGMTQAELAEILSYTDKAVSKWERRESVPDIAVLKSIADYFGVTVDYLITEDNDVPAESVSSEESEKIQRQLRRRSFVTGMSVLLVWLIATFAFVCLSVAGKTAVFRVLPFLYAVPASMIVWLVLNSVWFNARRNYLIISVMMWGFLLAVYVSLIAVGRNYPLMFTLGIPGQAIIFLWSRINRHTRDTSHN